MRIPVEFIRPRHLSRVATVAVLAGLGAGCSADTSRFADSPFSNPFKSQQTASIPEPDAYPTPRVTAQPLAASTVPSIRPIAAQPLPPVGSVGTMAASPSPQPSYTFNRRAGSNLSSTGTVSNAPRVTSSGRGGWSAAGGTVVAARDGDTVERLSNRYGVPAAAIREANGLGSGALEAGREVTIPVYNAGVPAAPRPVPPRQVSRLVPDADAEPAPRPARTSTVALQQRPSRPPAVEAAPARAASSRPLGGVHVVRPGETLISIAIAYGTTRPKLAKANDIDEWMNVRIGQRLRVPGDGGKFAAVNESAQREGDGSGARRKAPTLVHTAALKPEPDDDEKPTKPQTRPAAATPTSKPGAKAPKPVSEPTYDDEGEDPGPAETASVPSKPVAAEPAQRGATTFRWPVKGRVIQSFGQNTDGINISVPEGTEVKAAENGVVAYAGNELKGYGNLVLIRHADGFVTAYAHAKDLTVKRGDPVKRGQIIATAGQTGNVTSPQLLFELRKGATPVDPRRYLATN
jgi:murein DD-endopeptidase MepM/ murein hydrolase activator NlpD